MSKGKILVVMSYKWWGRDYPLMLLPFAVLTMGALIKWWFALYFLSASLYLVLSLDADMNLRVYKWVLDTDVGVGAGGWACVCLYFFFFFFLFFLFCLFSPLLTGLQYMWGAGLFSSFSSLLSPHGFRFAVTDVTIFLHKLQELNNEMKIDNYIYSGQNNCGKNLTIYGGYLENMSSWI